MIPCRVSQIIKSHRLNKAFFLTDRSLGNKLPASLLQAQRSFSSPLFYFFLSLSFLHSFVPCLFHFTSLEFNSYQALRAPFLSVSYWLISRFLCPERQFSQRKLRKKRCRARSNLDVNFPQHATSVQGDAFKLLRTFNQYFITKWWARQFDKPNSHRFHGCQGL